MCVFICLAVLKTMRSPNHDSNLRPLAYRANVLPVPMFCHENYRVALYPPTLPDSGTPLATASFRLFKISRVRHPRPYQHPRQQMPTQESKVNYFAPEKLPAVAVLEKMYNLTGIRTLYQQRLTMGGGGSNN